MKNSQSHLAEATAQGRDPAEARRAFGSPLRQREESRDIRVIPWLDSLRADAVFGWRQLMKRKVTSAAAMLSLALAIGACTSAFRLIDALLLRPLPVAHAERLYSVAFEGVGVDGKSTTSTTVAPIRCSPQMRAAAQGQAELIAVSYAGLIDLTYGSDQEMEKAYLQYVSGWIFTAFGLRPALGRLFTDNDDREPGAHPYAVISYDYWTRRFARDPKVDRPHVPDWRRALPNRRRRRGAFHRHGNRHDHRYLPSHGDEESAHARQPQQLLAAHAWCSSSPASLRSAFTRYLRATFAAMQEEKAKTLTETQRRRDPTFKEKMLLEPASAGRSNLQRDYRRSLTALGVLVFLVLLIACANVANLMTAQAAVACPRNGAADLHRRRARASGAACSDGKRVARIPRHRHRRHVRVVVRASHRAHHRFAGKSRPPGAPGGLARARVRHGPCARYYLRLRSCAGVARLRDEAGHRLAGR